MNDFAFGFQAWLGRVAAEAVVWIIVIAAFYALLAWLGRRSSRGGR